MVYRWKLTYFPYKIEMHRLLSTRKVEADKKLTIPCHYNTRLCNNYNSTRMKYCFGCQKFMCQWHIDNHTHFVVCSYRGCNNIAYEYGDPKKTYYDVRCSSHGFRGVQYDSYGRILYDGR
jgi:hypothetical protein